MHGSVPSSYDDRQSPSNTRRFPLDFSMGPVVGTWADYHLPWEAEALLFSFTKTACAILDSIRSACFSFRAILFFSKNRRSASPWLNLLKGFFALGRNKWVQCIQKGLDHHWQRFGRSVGALLLDSIPSRLQINIAEFLETVVTIFTLFRILIRPYDYCI